MNQQKALDVRQLPNVDEWEFYEVVVGGDEDDLYTIGLRPYPEFGAVEFELWDGDDEEPWDTGSVPSDATGPLWERALREPILREILETAKNKE